MSINPVFEKMRQSTLCPKCESTNMSFSAEMIEGATGLAQCADCGWMGRGQVQPARREVFEWSFDMNARTVCWDVTALLYSLPSIKDACFETVISYPTLLSFWQENQHREDIREEQESNHAGRPIVVIQHPTSFPDMVQMKFLPIDGWHRIARAVREQQNLPGIIVPREVETHFRVLDIVHVGIGDYAPENHMAVVLDNMEAASSEKVILPRNLK